MKTKNNQRIICGSSHDVNALLGPYSWTPFCGYSYDQYYNYNASNLGVSHSRASISDLSNVGELNEQEKNTVRLAMDLWQNVCGIRFKYDGTTTEPNTIVAKASVPGDRVGTTKIKYPVPPTILPLSQMLYADSFIRYVFAEGELYPGGIGFEAALHELGHSMGLAHPFFDETFPEKTAVLDFSHNNRDITLMSYTTGRYATGLHTYPYKFYPATPMLYDIAAAQSLYGANRNYLSGNTRYYIDGLLMAKDGDAPDAPSFYLPGKVMTLWDGGGIDTIDFSGMMSDVKIDLREGIDFNSDPNGNKYSPYVTTIADYRIFLAYGANIENAIGGQGNDIIAFGNNGHGEGGKGFDTYIVPNNHQGLITIKDSDGFGQILRGGEKLSGLALQRTSVQGVPLPNSYVLQGKKKSYTVSKGGISSNKRVVGGDDLIIEDGNGSIVQMEGAAPCQGQMGIRLINEGERLLYDFDDVNFIGYYPYTSSGIWPREGWVRLADNTLIINFLGRGGYCSMLKMDEDGVPMGDPIPLVRGSFGPLTALTNGNFVSNNQYGGLCTYSADGISLSEMQQVNVASGSVAPLSDGGFMFIGSNNTLINGTYHAFVEGRRFNPMGIATGERIVYMDITSTVNEGIGNKFFHSAPLPNNQTALVWASYRSGRVSSIYTNILDSSSGRPLQEPKPINTPLWDVRYGELRATATSEGFAVTVQNFPAGYKDAHISFFDTSGVLVNERALPFYGGYISNIYNLPNNQVMISYNDIVSGTAWGAVINTAGDFIKEPFRLNTPEGEAVWGHIAPPHKGKSVLFWVNTCTNSPIMAKSFMLDIGHSIPVSPNILGTNANEQFSLVLDNSRLDASGGDDQVGVFSKNNRVILGAGNDTAVLRPLPTQLGRSETVVTNTIVDFQPGEDRLDISGYGGFGNITLSSLGNSTVVQLNTFDNVVLEDVLPQQLHEEDFSGVSVLTSLPSTEQQTTNPPSTVLPTTSETTIGSSTTQEGTTIIPTLSPSTTQQTSPTVQITDSLTTEQTTDIPTISESTSDILTTVQPTTEQPSTVLESTITPTTLQPTVLDTTDVPSTNQETTGQESSLFPSSETPTTEQPSTSQMPTVWEETTHLPTESPTSPMPTSQDSTVTETTDIPSTNQETTPSPSTGIDSTGQDSTLPPSTFINESTEGQSSTVPSTYTPSPTQENTQLESSQVPTSETPTTDTPSTSQMPISLEETTQLGSTEQPGTETSSTQLPTESPTTIITQTQEIASDQPTEGTSSNPPHQSVTPSPGGEITGTPSSLEETTNPLTTSTQEHSTVIPSSGTPTVAGVTVTETMDIPSTNQESTLSPSTGINSTGQDTTLPPSTFVNESTEGQSSTIPSTDTPSPTQESTQLESSQVPSSEIPTTDTPSTLEETTDTPTTLLSTVQEMTTDQPSTVLESTIIPTTLQPTTVDTTDVPSTSQETTGQESSLLPSSETPTTGTPTNSQMPTSLEETTQLGFTEQPGMETSSTQLPTESPTTITSAQSTVTPSSEIPTTQDSTGQVTEMTTDTLSTQPPSTLTPGSISPIVENTQVDTETPTSDNPGTVLPSGEGSTQLLTESPTSPMPTSQDSTVVDTTDVPSTNQESTQSPSTGIDSTGQDTTLPPSTFVNESTEGQSSTIPSTGTPSTTQEDTLLPSTLIPSSRTPTTDTPSTKIPSTTLETTQQPSLQLTHTLGRTTYIPTTPQPTLKETVSPTQELITPTTNPGFTNTPVPTHSTTPTPKPSTSSGSINEPFYMPFVRTVQEGMGQMFTSTGDNETTGFDPVQQEPTGKLSGTENSLVPYIPPSQTSPENGFLVNTSTPEQPCYFKDGTTNIRFDSGNLPEDMLIGKCQLEKPNPSIPSYGNVLASSFTSGMVLQLMPELVKDCMLSKGYSQWWSGAVSNSVYYGLLAYQTTSLVPLGISTIVSKALNYMGVSQETTATITNMASILAGLAQNTSNPVSFVTSLGGGIAGNYVGKFLEKELARRYLSDETEKKVVGF